MLRIKSLLTFVAVAAALCEIPVTAASPKVGERHADFTLATISDGKPVSLADFRGKKILLIQFASW